jgi:DNA-binding CsgD family transcriptional regulator/tetratricopeptide (TPR) repeat protein
LCVRLLERELQLAALAEYADEARRGDGRVVLVSGEAGVGKSALVTQLEQQVTDASWSWGVCDGLFTPRPLGPLFDLASQLGGELAKLCSAGASREDLFSALLRQVSQPRALNAIVIEDVHWADEATVDLLSFVGRRLRGARVLLIATYRDDALMPGDPLRVALGDLATQRSTRRVSLAPLSVGAVGILADGSELAVAELYRLTGGNPFYVTEVLNAGTGGVPTSARDAVLSRVSRLSADSREVLEIAALTGTRVDLVLLKSVTTCEPVVFDELLRSGLLGEDGERLRFRHEIARRAIEQEIAAHRRGRIHSRILAGLRALGCDDAAEMAFHAEGAADGQAVLQLAPQAARQAAELGSHREAAAQLERALRFAAPADAAKAAELYEALSDELTLVDRADDAIEAAKRSVALWRDAGNKLREGDILRKLACALEHGGRGAESLSAGEAAVASLEPMGPTIELAAAYSGLACRRMVLNRHDEAIECAERALAIAEPLGAIDVMSDALNFQACSVYSMGGEWAGIMGRSLEIAVAAGYHNQAGRAFANFYAIYAADRRFAEADQLFRDGIAYCDEHEMATHATSMRSERANALERTGRWPEAIELSTQIMADEKAATLSRIVPQMVIGIIRARFGDTGAWPYLDESCAAAEETAMPQFIIPARLARAEGYWLQGERFLAKAEAELADDVSVDADEWERGAVGVWLRRTMSDRPPRGGVAGPYRLELEGDGETAARAWAEIGCPYDQAMALLGVASEDAWLAALAIFTELGATSLARITRRNMRAAGMQSIPSGPRSATREHPLKLTQREHQVLDLICQGRTNAQIADQLFISTKTVAHHVSAILAKLEAPTRNVAAMQAVQLGLVGVVPP